MKNIINTSKKFILVTAISLSSIFLFSVPTYAHADVWSRLGNFFEDAWDDVSDLPGDVWDGISHTTKSAWDHIEDEVEDWHIDIDWNDRDNYWHSGNYEVRGYNYWNDSYCTSCGCGSTSTCSGWNSQNNNTYLPNNYTYYYGGGWDSYNYGYNYNNYGPLNGSCSAGVSNTEVGGLVTWTASATGGNGFYTYYWSGDEGLSSNGQTAPKTYSYGGTKNATLTITSNGQSITRTCSVNVNQVLAYTQTNPYVASVYLSDIPYTGAGDTLKVILFIMILIVWSALIAYMFVRKNSTQEVPVAIGAGDMIVSEINKDLKEMSQIEDYARENEIIISQGAIISLLKSKRLHNKNISEIIKNIIKNKEKTENGWITIGEGDLEIYL